VKKTKEGESVIDWHCNFYQDYENDGFVWDMAAHGFYLGLGIGF
jgi:hypothetical protein